MRTSTRAPLVALTIAVTAIADAGEPPSVDEELSVTITVVGRAAESETATQTSIDATRIEASDARTASELLWAVPGARALRAGGRSGSSTVQVRGGDPNFTLVLLDGVPLNDPTDPEGGAFDLESLPAQALESAAIVRGPLSAYLGSAGLAGALDLRSRSADAERLGLEASLAFGDASYLRGALAVDGSATSRPWRLRMSYEDEAGRIGDDAFEQLYLTGGVELPIGSSRLELAGRAARTEGRDYPEASGGPVFGSGGLRTTESDEASLAATYDLGDRGGFRHVVTATISARARDRDSPAIGFQVPASRESTLYRRTRAGWSLTRDLTGGHAFGGGLELEHEDAENESVLLLPPELGGEVPGDYDEARLIGALYGDGLVRLGRARIELGLRVDFPDGHAVEASPRIGAAVDLGTETELRGTLGRAFKLPSFFALASPPTLGGNPELAPETSVGGDLGLRHRVTSVGLELGLTYFHTVYHDLVDFDFERFLHVNRAEVRAIGVELDGIWQPHGAIDVRANATYQDVEDRATGERLLHRPRWYGGAAVDWRAHPRLSLHLDLDATAGYLDQQITAPERGRVDGYALLGLTATVRPLERLELTARVDNLTDTDYETFIGFPGPGASFRIGARWRWAR